MNTVRVIINGVEYSLKGEEREEYLHKVASYVDKKLTEIKENNNKLSTSSAAVLTAVNIADELFKIKNELSELFKKVEEIYNDDKRIKEENISLKKQLSHLENYNAELTEKIKKSNNNEYILRLEGDIKKLNEQITIMGEESKKYLQEIQMLKEENKAIKMKNQSYNSEIISLKKDILEKEIELTKERKMRNPLKKADDI
ncbi:cell division protein ZapA [Clostridium tepidiprofundi DSM 19306]|uniref:Cell division protein ZapA n=1 Tax=Clostridium tepidiprofundi DSM 19306 TaxID=1121338 RepID=A0A151AUH0_9CLOT|nr:cell division protein ZapA [Clostridium tepidiprofundi]KYH31057.1 cell division protein ZapA [Clostridium tepidiprofundi DSM 19306]